MKIVVIGRTGLIDSKPIGKPREHSHEAIPASPDTGVDTLAHEGLAEVLEGADVVVDVSKSPSFANDPMLHFFRTSTTNLLAAEDKACVGHQWQPGVAHRNAVPYSRLTVPGVGSRGSMGFVFGAYFDFAPSLQPPPTARAETPTCRATEMVLDGK